MLPALLAFVGRAISRTCPLRSPRQAPLTRALGLLTLVVLTLVVPGVVQTAPARAADPPAFNLDYIPDEAQLVFACRPAELVKMKPLASVKAVFESIGLFEPLSLPLEEVEEAKVSVVGTLGRDDNNSYSVFALRSFKAHDWTRLGEYFTGQTEQVIVDGQQTFRSTRTGSAGRFSYWLPDDRTIVVVPTNTIAKTFTLRGGEGGPAWKAKWESVAQASAVVMLQRPFYEVFVAEAAGQGNGPPMPVPVFGDDVLLLSARQTGSDVVISGKLDFASADEAQAELSRLQNAMNAFLERSQARPARGGPDADAQIGRMILQTLADTKLQVVGAKLQSQTPVSFVAEQQGLDAANAARAAAQQKQSTNKMKQLAIALQNYHDVWKRFPPPFTKGPDGKPLHSWRFYLLPFLGEEAEALYNDFNRHEPWDSEHNKKLIERGAKFFSLPSDKGNQYCGYLAITGPGTIFDETAQPMSFRKITDGTSRTIWLVEAKSKIPWSKPEDLKIDAEKPLPKLGGVLPDGFTASYADGSVQHVPGTVNEKTLRALFSRAGREVINTDDNGPVNLEE